MRPTKLNKRTMPKRKSVKAPTTKQNKVKVKPKFSLKGIPAKYKMICNLAIEHADTQLQCDELLLVGVNAYEALLDIHTPDFAEKYKLDTVTKAILDKKQSYTSNS